MSLVGPRPEVPRYLGPSTPHYDELVRRRPGLTDPASLAYRDEAELLAGSADPETYYRDVILPAKIQLSVDYARQRTVSSDLKVLATTATRVLLPHR
jgi:lipopolysaccharide/colanic/teichoic acid biosynthesis glycosyltransferase